MSTLVEIRLSGARLLVKSPQRRGLKDSCEESCSLINLRVIFFCLVLALESQTSFLNFSPCGFAQNDWLWLLHHLHCCHSIFNLSLEASPMQSCCKSSGPVQKTAVALETPCDASMTSTVALETPYDVSMISTSVFPFCPGRQTHCEQDWCLAPKPNSPPLPVWPSSTGPGRPQTQHLLVPLALITRSVFWMSSPVCGQLMSDGCGHVALPRAPCCHPSVPWPQAGTSTSTESLFLITAISVETTSSVGEIIRIWEMPDRINWKSRFFFSFLLAFPHHDFNV